VYIKSAFFLKKLLLASVKLRKGSSSFSNYAGPNDACLYIWAETLKVNICSALTVNFALSRHLSRLLFVNAEKVSYARIYRPAIRENKPKTLVLISSSTQFQYLKTTLQSDLFQNMLRPASLATNWYENERLGLVFTKMLVSCPIQGL
jgi:hypothetical protein